MRIGSKILITLMIFVLCACSDDFSSGHTKRNVKTYKVAVVMPKDRQETWTRTAQWALDNLAEAQTGLSEEIKLSLQWFDENSPEIDTQLKNISNDDSYVSIIGPYSSQNAHTAAQLCAKSGKTLILPIATSAEVQRIYAGVGNIWNLTQSDISQCELMLTQALLSESRNVSLITSDDDHIILIIADNIAYDSRNIYPGVVRVRPNGENVYEGAVVDYKIGDIKITDLKAIMTGQKSEKHPEVITPNKHDNVVVFWCGHGAKNSLMWGSDDVVYGCQIADLIQSMTYRKMLWSMDACYSGTIGEACIGIPGLLVITSANAYEPSKADMKDPEMRIWLSNGFTREFQETVDAKPDIILRDLYYELARNTVGSHTTVYNVENYGNMYKESMNEYF